MRSGETLRRDTVRFLLAAIQTEEKARLGAAVDKLVAEGKDETARRSWLAQNKPGELDDAAVTEVLTKQAKMRRDSMEAFRKGERPDLVKKEEQELAFISAYLPAQLDEVKIREIATRVIGETGAKGCLLVTVDHRGRADPQPRALDVFRWAKVEVKAAEAESTEEAMGAAALWCRQRLAVEPLDRFLRRAELRRIGAHHDDVATLAG